jgi:hypothetical protein
MPRGSQGWFAIGGLGLFAFWLYVFLPLLYMPGERRLLDVTPGEWLTFAATFLLFVATLGLWLATVRLVRGAEKTAERQLRAYLGITQATASNFGAGQIFMVSITVKNSGQTPAYKVTQHYSIMGGAYPRKEPLPQVVVPGGPSTLGPGEVHILEISMHRPLPGSAYSQITSGDAAIYIWGSIMYEDTFGSSRETRFSYIFGGRFGVHRGGAVVPSEDGNMST